MTGTIKFDDADGDVASIVTQVSAEKGAQTTPLKVSGTKTGTAAFTLVLRPKKVGPQTVEVWVHDAGDNSSNRLTGTIEVKERQKPDKPEAGSGSDKPEAGSGSDKPEAGSDKPEKPEAGSDKPEAGSDKPEG